MRVRDAGGHQLRLGTGATKLSRLGRPGRPAWKAANVALSPGAFRPLGPPSPITRMEWSRGVPTDWRRLGLLRRKEEDPSPCTPGIRGPLLPRRDS